MYLCKLGQNPSNGSEDNARKRSYADADADADGIRTKNSISSHPSGFGNITMCHTVSYWTNVEISLNGDFVNYFGVLG